MMETWVGMMQLVSAMRTSKGDYKVGRSLIEPPCKRPLLRDIQGLSAYLDFRDRPPFL